MDPKSKKTFKKWTMEEIVEANQKEGYLFFYPSTMRFWKTRLLPSSVKSSHRGIFFVTSDAMGSERVYTVRRFDSEDARIRTIQRYDTLAQAITRARNEAEGTVQPS